MKFRGRLADARLLGQLFAETMQPQVGEMPAVLLPVPLHPQRVRERGFNQAVELARPLARMFGWPLARRAVRRVKPTLHQTGLGAAERERNVRGAFVVDKLPGRRLIIIDDVVTTGATVFELAKTLRRAGAEHVEVWSLTRTVPND